MKHIKKYNEDLEWIFDEEESNPFKIGDTVVLKGISYKRTLYLNSNHKKSDNYRIIFTTSINKTERIIDIDYRDDGKMVFKLEKKWPWFVSDYWEKVD